MKNTYLFVASLSVLLACSSDDSPTPKIQDGDGNIYTSVVIHDQEWLTSNLRTTRYSDGSPINQMPTNSLLPVADGQSWKKAYELFLYYNHLQPNAALGLFYGFPVTESGRNPCPCGFRVPTKADYDRLRHWTGPEARQIRSTTGWINVPDYIAGTNEMKFNAFANGYYEFTDNGFEHYDKGYTAKFWLNNEGSINYYGFYTVANEFAIEYIANSPTLFAPIRCMRDVQ
jgi:uncharacterized protein (TIGR02145 family)